jgi:hypothetical protein
MDATLAPPNTFKVTNERASLIGWSIALATIVIGSLLTVLLILLSGLHEPQPDQSTTPAPTSSMAVDAATYGQPNAAAVFQVTAGPEHYHASTQSFTWVDGQANPQATPKLLAETRLRHTLINANDYLVAATFPGQTITGVTFVTPSGRQYPADPTGRGNAREFLVEEGTYIVWVAGAGAPDSRRPGHAQLTSNETLFFLRGQITAGGTTVPEAYPPR